MRAARRSAASAVERAPAPDLRIEGGVAPQPRAASPAPTTRGSAWHSPAIWPNPVYNQPVGGGCAQTDRKAPISQGRGSRRHAGCVEWLPTRARGQPPGYQGKAATRSSARQRRSHHAGDGVHSSLPRRGPALRCGEDRREDGGPQLRPRRQRLVVVLGLRRHCHRQRHGHRRARYRGHRLRRAGADDGAAAAARRCRA